MPTIDDVVERARIATGADFAFILTLRARLVTSAAPRDMPALGRSRIVYQALDLLTTGRIGVLTLPRQELVPYGGAAPVDVFVAVAANRAVVALVMASWADKTPVIPGIADAVNELEPILASAWGLRAPKPEVVQEPKKPPVMPFAPPPPPAPALPTAREVRETRGTSGRGRRRGSSSGVVTKAAPDVEKADKAKATSAQGSKVKRRGPMAGLLSMAGSKMAPAAPRKAPRITMNDSTPEIIVSPATVGRATLEAIELDERSQDSRRGAPSSSRRTSIPEIRVELASISPVSERDLRREEAAQMQSRAAAADRIVPRADSRATHPWVEDPADTKRAADAAAASRRVAPPKVTLKLEEADEQILKALLVDGIDPGPVASEDGPPSSRRGAVDTAALLADAPRPKLSSIDTWRAALEQTIAHEESSRR